MSVAKGMLSASAVNGKIYAIGGASRESNVLSLVEEYIPEGWQAISPQDKLPQTWGTLKGK